MDKKEDTQNHLARQLYSTTVNTGSWAMINSPRLQSFPQ